VKPSKLRARMAAAPLAQPKPPPLWVTTDSSEYARTAVSRVAAARHLAEAAALAKAEGGLVASHPAQYVGDPITAGARALARLSESKGLRTQIIAGLFSCTVEGIDVARGIGFRMTWTRGRADSSGTWHEARVRYDYVLDERPVGVHKTAYVGLAGHRPAGMPALHLTIVATPAGVPLNLTALKAKLNGLDQ
jgi:hypothetical protein